MPALTLCALVLAACGGGSGGPAVSLADTIVADKLASGPVQAYTPGTWIPTQKPGRDFTGLQQAAVVGDAAAIVSPSLDVVAFATAIEAEAYLRSVSGRVPSEEALCGSAVVEGAGALAVVRKLNCPQDA